MNFANPKVGGKKRGPTLSPTLRLRILQPYFAKYGFIQQHNTKLPAITANFTQAKGHGLYIQTHTYVHKKGTQGPSTRNE